MQVLAVFILEDALSVKTDNTSMAVFILRTHYPSGRTWENICRGAPFLSKSTHPREFGNHVTVHRPTVRPHHRRTNVYSHTLS